MNDNLQRQSVLKLIRKVVESQCSCSSCLGDPSTSYCFDKRWSSIFRKRKEQARQSVSRHNFADPKGNTYIVQQHLHKQRMYHSIMQAKNGRCFLHEAMEINYQFCGAGLTSQTLHQVLLAGSYLFAIGD